MAPELQDDRGNPPRSLFYTSRRQSQTFTVLEKPTSKVFLREERTQERGFFAALFTTPGVSLAVLRGWAVMLSQLLIPVTPLGLGMLNPQAAGNADPADPGGMSCGGLCISLDAGASGNVPS